MLSVVGKEQEFIREVEWEALHQSVDFGMAELSGAVLDLAELDFIYAELDPEGMVHGPAAQISPPLGEDPL